jgi:hypothetical protein
LLNLLAAHATQAANASTAAPTARATPCFSRAGISSSSSTASA